MEGPAQWRRRLDHDDPRVVGDRVGDLRQHVGMHDQDRGAAVAQDIAGLLGLEMPVDRAGVAAGQPCRQHRLEPGDVVAQHDGDHVARPHAEPVERADAAQRAVGQSGAVEPAVSEDEVCDRH